MKTRAEIIALLNNLIRQSELRSKRYKTAPEFAVLGEWGDSLKRETLATERSLRRALKKLVK